MNKFGKDGLIEITVTKKGKRKLKELALFASLAVPPVLLLTMLDVWMRHPVAAAVFLGAASAWDILFAVANKKPRAATRGRARKCRPKTTFSASILSRTMRICQRR